MTRVARKLGRCALGIELKESYWRLAVKYLAELEAAPEPQAAAGAGELAGGTPGPGDELAPG